MKQSLQVSYQATLKMPSRCVKEKEPIASSSFFLVILVAGRSYAAIENQSLQN